MWGAQREWVQRNVSLYLNLTIFEAGVASAGGDGQMDEVPGENDGGEAAEVEGGYEGVTKIVKVLDGVHGHPAERFRVGVAVVQLVHVGVHGADVEEAVGDVEVEVAPDRDEQHPGHVEAEERPSSNGRTHPRSSV